MVALKFRTPRVQEEWTSGNVWPLLTEMFLDAADYAAEVFDWDFEIECVYRTPDEDAAVGGHGVHPLWRAIDVRTFSVGIPDYIIQAVAKYVNDRYRYDPLRPQLVCCLDESDAAHGPHMHLQVHERTEFLNPSIPSTPQKFEST